MASDWATAVDAHPHETRPRHASPRYAFMAALLEASRIRRASSGVVAARCTPLRLADFVQGIAERTHQAIDLGLLRDEGRRQLDRVAAVAHVEALLPARHGDLERAARRLAGC